MGIKYYISQRPNEDGRYYIHSEDCPLIPSPVKRMFLGTFLSPEDAETAAGRYYRNTGFCRFCLKESHEKRKRTIPAALSGRNDFIKSAAIVSSIEIMLVCGIN
jgi:hypothetical protein